MNDLEVRLKCVDLALKAPYDEDDIISKAEKIYNFVEGKFIEETTNNKQSNKEDK